MGVILPNLKLVSTKTRLSKRFMIDQVCSRARISFNFRHALFDFSFFSNYRSHAIDVLMTNVLSDESFFKQHVPRFKIPHIFLDLSSTF